MLELQKTLQSRLDAKLVSTCGILKICISYKSKHIDDFNSDSQYMFHSWCNTEDGVDIFWGHYDLTLSQALNIWKDKINQSPKVKR